MNTLTLPTWPLPAARIARAHLSWNDVVAATTTTALCQQRMPVLMREMSAQLSKGSERFLNARANAPLCWPLPQTLAPKARLTWAAYCAQRTSPHSTRLTLDQDAPAAPVRVEHAERELAIVGR